MGLEPKWATNDSYHGQGTSHGFLQYTQFPLQTTVTDSWWKSGQEGYRADCPCYLSFHPSSWGYSYKHLAHWLYYVSPKTRENPI